MISMIKSTFALISAISFLGIGACQSQNDAGLKKKAHWSYTGSTGPESWASLSTDYKTCSSGRLQSPFDIKADLSADLPDMALKYNPLNTTVLNNGHTIQLDLNGAGYLEVEDRQFDVLQLHFHTKSEYAIAGEFFPMSMHIVHKSKDGDLAVIGVMFTEGESNRQLSALWEKLPKKESQTTTLRSLDIMDLIPEDRTYYRFMGSLTTPPCSEGVNWYVMKTPVSVSAEQIATFRELFRMNARPLQDENNRLVVLDG